MQRPGTILRRRLVAVWCGVFAALCAWGGKVSFQTGDVFGAATLLEGDFAADALAVELEGERLYVGGRGFIAVYDVGADPVRPRLLGKTDGIATVRQMAIHDGIVYAVARSEGLWITDCRNPKAPKTVGHLPLTLNSTGVDVAGNVAFVGGSRSGIGFVDVSDPTRPQLVAIVRQEPVESQSVAYRNGHLYSGEWNAKCVSVWDCRDLKDIRRVAQSALPSNGDGVWPVGNWLYACTGWSTADKKRDAQPRPGQMGLSIFDISAPAAPKAVGRVDFEYCKASGIDMWIPRSSGDLVFCAQNLSGLYAVDVSNKAKPRVLDRWILPAGKGAGFAKKAAVGQPSRLIASVAVGDGVVYMAGPGGVGARVLTAKGARREAVDRGTPPVNWSVRPPRPPAPKGFHRWLPEDPSLAATVTGLAVKDDTCYVAAGTAGLFVLALSKDGIRELRRIPLAECMDAAVAGNRLFVAAGRGGFIGYEIHSPTELREFMRYPSKGARDVYAFGDGKRWVVFNTGIHDIGDPGNPKFLVGLVHQSRWNKFMCPDLIAGRWAAGNSSLRFLGWADLLADVVVETNVRDYVPSGGAMCAFGAKAFLADGGKWAIVEPGSTEPPKMRAFPKGGVEHGLPRAKGTLVALAGAGGRVGVWDFSDPEKPKPLKSYSVPGSCEPVSFWNDDVVIPALTLGVLLPK